MQAVVKLALEPEWETRFEANSYGFRPGRCTMDAIEAIFTALGQKGLLRCNCPQAVADEAADFHENNRALAQGWLDRHGCLARQRGGYAAGRDSFSRVGQCRARWDGATLRL